MHISFENKLGKIDLNGKVWRVKDIDGLGFLEKNVSVVRYPSEDGQEVLESVIHARTITISGDILRKDKMESELSRAMRIFNKSGVLKIHFGTKRRKIACRCTVFSAGTKERNALYQSFVMQLVCDYPYFEDFDETKMSLFIREDLIKNSFTLPCVFSRRVSRVNLVNSGDELTRPRIYLVCSKEGESSAGIEITNHTTGNSFCLEYKMSVGEEICIDFDNRTITSNIKTEENNDGNLIVYMSDNTFLSDFYLESGVNDVECIVHDEKSEISAVCEYSNKYIEAVV